MKDIIELNENNICVSANCDYSKEVKTIEYQFNNKKERLNFFSNIQFYKYDGKKIIELSDKEKEELYPTTIPQPTFEETQNDFNIDVDYRLSVLELGI